MKKLLFAIMAVLILLTAALPAMSAENGAKIIKETISQKQDKYEIKFEYPRIEFPGDKKVEKKINDTIKKDVENEISVFKADYREAGAEVSPDRPWSMTFEYKVPFENKQILSVFIEGYTYTGGAHGMPLYIMYSFDMKTGAVMTLDQLFKSDARYLKELSRICKEELGTRELPDDDMFTQGSDPDPANYQFFLIQKDGLMILFPPYQVAPYAFGAQEVLIPWSKIKNLIDPKSPVRHLCK